MEACVSKKERKKKGAKADLELGGKVPALAVPAYRTSNSSYMTSDQAADAVRCGDSAAQDGHQRWNHHAGQMEARLQHRVLIHWSRTL